MGNPNAAHYSVGVYLVEDKRGRKKVLVTKYRNKDANDRIEVRLPGGCQEDGETPIETLIREWRMETGYSLKSDEVEQAGAPTPALKDPNHQKYVFLVSDVHGSPFTDSDCLGWDKPGNERENGAPEWMRVDDAANALYFSHRNYLKQALEYFLKAGLIEG